MLGAASTEARKPIGESYDYDTHREPEAARAAMHRIGCAGRDVRHVVLDKGRTQLSGTDSSIAHPVAGLMEMRRILRIEPIVRVGRAGKAVPECRG